MPLQKHHNYLLASLDESNNSDLIYFIIHIIYKTNFNYNTKSFSFFSTTSLKLFFYKYNNYFSYMKLKKFNSRKKLSNFYFSKNLFYVGHFLNSILLLSLNIWLLRHKIIYYKEVFSICNQNSLIHLYSVK